MRLGYIKDVNTVYISRISLKKELLHRKAAALGVDKLLPNKFNKGYCKAIDSMLEIIEETGKK